MYSAKASSFLLTEPHIVQAVSQMGTARDTVLAGPGILCDILSNLDMRTLLLAQRVSHQWHDVITKEAKLQRKLFFLSDEKKEIRIKNPLLSKHFPHWFAFGDWEHNGNFTKSDLDTLKFVRTRLHDVFPPWFGDRKRNNSFRSGEAVKLRDSRGLLHKLLLRWKLSRKKTREQEPKAHASRVCMFDQEDLKTLTLAYENRNDAFTYEKASWRRMLLTQPPIHSFIACHSASTMGGQHFFLQSATSEGTIYVPVDKGDEDKPKTPTQNPIRMETFYNLVTGGIGGDHHWLFIWKDLKNLDPVPTDPDGENKFDSHLKKSLFEDGLVMFSCSVAQCEESGPWRFEDKYRLKVSGSS